MNAKSIITVIGTLFLIFGVALTGFCDERMNVSPSLIYGAFVDNYIQKFEAKAEMLDSGSFNIRKNALRATVKAAYVKSNRDIMVAYLVEKNVPFNGDRIEYHLNQKFTESVSPQKVYALLSKEHFDRKEITFEPIQ